MLTPLVQRERQCCRCCPCAHVEPPDSLRDRYARMAAPVRIGGNEPRVDSILSTG